VLLLRSFCDDATKLIRSTIDDSLNAKLIGTAYAGGVEKVRMDRYLERARVLGRETTRLAAERSRCLPKIEA